MIDFFVPGHSDADPDKAHAKKKSREEDDGRIRRRYFSFFIIFFKEFCRYFWITILSDEHNWSTRYTATHFSLMI